MENIEQIIYNRYQAGRKKVRPRDIIKKLVPSRLLLFFGGIFKIGQNGRRLKKFKLFLSPPPPPPHTHSFPLFNVVQIETINRCNGSCSFCGVNRHNDPRPYAKMEGKLFDSIINQLHIINYSGLLELCSNNEPFLDGRIIEFAKRSKHALPNAKIRLLTNGSVLTLDKFIDIIEYLDELIIDNYNDELKLNRYPQVIYDYCTLKNIYRNKLKIMLRKENEVLSTRAGSSPNKKTSKIMPQICPAPFDQLVIRPDGRISLCCCDAFGVITLGDTNENTLLEIWSSERYKKIREQSIKGRKNINICRYCDTEF